MSPFLRQPLAVAAPIKTLDPSPLMFGDSPNITGAVKEVPVLNTGVVTEGALLVGEKAGYSIQGKDSTATGLRFDSSQSNGIYGKSLTVQPSALRLLSCIKF